jgi:imidazolonepropionase-like amidohydrolase
MKYSTIILLLSWITGICFGQRQAPASSQEKPILLKGGVLHLGNGDKINDGSVAFEDGIITYVGTADAFDQNESRYEVIPLNGKEVYPGFILPDSQLGLTEIGAVRATLDFSETGDLNPNVRSVIAFNTDSELIPATRFNGIQIVQVAPSGGLVSGTSSVVHLDAWNWEDAVVNLDEGIFVNWPLQKLRPRWWRGETDYRKNEQFEEQVELISNLFRDASAYAQISKPKKPNVKLESLKGLFTGDQKLFVRVNDATGIITACKFFKRLEVQHIVLVGAEEALEVVDFIKSNNISIVLGNIHALPPQEGSEVDFYYSLPSKLAEAGVLFCFSYDDESNARNLPFVAGNAVSYGLDKELAIQSITGNAAKILGIEDKTGRLQKGLQANLVVSEGDALDMRTNNITQSFIQGRKITLKGLQQNLYEMYSNKYGHEE